MHPDARKRTFIPVAEYDQVVFEAKRAEFFEIARQLRAKTIGTKSDEGNVSSKGVNASVGTDGGSVGGAASKSEQQQRNQGMKQEFGRPKNGKPAFDQDMVHFYHDESDWKAMVNGRMDVEGAQTSTYDCKFTYTAEKRKLSEYLAVGLKGIGGLNYGGESENFLSIDETCTVTFWDGNEVARQSKDLFSLCDSSTVSWRTVKHEVANGLSVHSRMQSNDHKDAGCPRGTTPLRFLIQNNRACPYDADRIDDVKKTKHILIEAGVGEKGNNRAIEICKKANQAKTLDLSNLDMTCLPEELRLCTKLEVLELRGNCLQEVPGWICELLALRTLDLSQNDLQEVVPAGVCELASLKELDLRDNPFLTRLPDELADLTSLTTLRLGNERGRVHCRQMTNPSSVVMRCLYRKWFPTGQERSSLRDVFSFFSDDLAGTSTNMQVKVLLLGLGEAGKTSFANAVQHGESQLVAKKARTEGIELREHLVDAPTQADKKRKAILLLYDFAGQEDYYITHHLFLTSGALYMLVFDLHKYECTDESFQRLVMDWVRSIQARCPGVKLMLVGTHADMIEGEGESEARCNHVIQSLQAEKDSELTYIRSKLSTLTGTDDAQIQRRIYQVNSQEIPDKVHAVSCSKGLQGISETVAAMTSAIQEKKFFAHLGQEVPKKYATLIEHVRKAREITPRLSWNDYLYLGYLSGIDGAELEVAFKDDATKGLEGLVLSESSPVLDKETEHDAILVRRDSKQVLRHISPFESRKKKGQHMHYDLRIGNALMRATLFAKALGELLIFEFDSELVTMPILSPSWLANAMKCIVCHNHETNLQFNTEISDSLDPRSFELAKRQLIDRGLLSKQLLRRLWAPIGLTEDSYAIMCKLLTQFEVAIELAGTGSLLVPTFLPQYLPASIWPPECAAGTMQLQWWYAIHSFQPAGLMERMIVLLQEADDYTQFQCAKEGIVLRGAGGCKILCELTKHSEFNEKGVRITVRGPQAEEGTMGAKGWQHAKRVLSTLDELLEQWRGMMVFKYVVVQRQVKVVCAECSELWPSETTEQAVCAKCGHGHFNDQPGEPAYVPLLQAQSARKGGKVTVVLPPPPNDAWVEEQVAVEKLLGPADNATKDEADDGDGNDEDGEDDVNEDSELIGGAGTTLVSQGEPAGGADDGEEDSDHEAAIDSHGKVAGGTEEEEEFEDYRVVIESMQKAEQQWIMLSYCWGKRDKKTGQYDMQQIVIKVFRRLVKEHGLPVWLDIFGGMGSDVYESMGRGVRGAAIVVPFMSSAYDTSTNGKRELKFACNLEKPLVPVMAEAGFNHNDSTWLGVCVPGELYYPIEDKSELAFNKQVDDLAAAITKQLKVEPLATGVRKSDVAAFLFGHQLGKYAEVLEKEGSVDQLRLIATEEGEDWEMLLMRSKMTPVHQFKLREALGVSPARANIDTSARPVFPHAQLDNMITITEQKVDVEPAVKDKKKWQGDKHMPVLINMVNEKLYADLSSCSDECSKRELEIDAHDFKLSFLPKEAGDAQIISIFKPGKRLLLLLLVETKNCTPASWGSGRFFSQTAMSVTGKVRICAAHTPEGEAKLLEISELCEEKQNIKINQLVTNLSCQLPLPAEDCILVFNRKDYEKQMKKTSPGVHLFNADDQSHVQLLKTCRFHGKSRHFASNVLYRLHPDRSKRMYIPADQYHQCVIQAMREEFTRIARQLGAKSITVAQVESNAEHTAVNGEGGAQGMSVGGSVENSGETHSNQTMDLSNIPKPKAQTFDPAETYFYEEEPDWQVMADSRRENDIGKYRCTFKYTADDSKSASANVGYQQFVSLGASASKTQHKDVNEIYIVEFWQKIGC
jgi:GTPase SAR1 family protein